MTVNDLIIDLEYRISELKKLIETDVYNGEVPTHKYIALNTYEYCLNRLKEIKNS